jgi:hypothetical protein
MLKMCLLKNDPLDVCNNSVIMILLNRRNAVVFSGLFP